MALPNGPTEIAASRCFAVEKVPENNGRVSAKVALQAEEQEQGRNPFGVEVVSRFAKRGFARAYGAILLAC